MKKIFYLIVPFFLFACESNTVEEPLFGVSTDADTYSVGEKVTFKFTGNPEIISFYSGEPGNSYAYAAIERIAEADLVVSFQTQNRSQAYRGDDLGAGFCQEDQLKVKVSNDFTGEYDAASVAAATWVDLTDLFSIGPVTCNSTSSYLPAGEVNIGNSLEGGKPFYFAFHYINQHNSEYGNCNIWRFSSFEMNAVSEKDQVPVAMQESAEWQPVFVGEEWNETRGFILAKTNVTMRSDPAQRNNYQELWCISKSFVFEKEVNLGTDKSVGVKSVADGNMETFDYVFEEPGLYTVTFVAVNANIYGRKEVVKHLDIEIVP